MSSEQMWAGSAGGNAQVHIYTGQSEEPEVRELGKLSRHFWQSRHSSRARTEPYGMAAASTETVAGLYLGTVGLRDLQPQRRLFIACQTSSTNRRRESMLVLLLAAHVSYSAKCSLNFWGLQAKPTEQSRALQNFMVRGFVQGLGVEYSIQRDDLKTQIRSAPVRGVTSSANMVPAAFYGPVAPSHYVEVSS